MAYVYQHIRMDELIPYYVGIGFKDNGYKRSKVKQNRSKYWKNINNKVETKIEIIKDGLSVEEALLWEQFYIKLYVRKDSGGRGILCNLTDGGEGTVNLSKESIEKIRQKNLKRKDLVRRPILRINKDGEILEEFESVGMVRYSGYKRNCVFDCLSGRNKTHKGFIWKYKHHIEAT